MEKRKSKHNWVPLHTHQNDNTSNNDIENKTVDEDVEKSEPSYVADGSAKPCSFYGKELLFPQKVKLRTSNSTPRPIPKDLKNRFSNKYLYRNVHSSTAHDSQKVETNPMSIN